MHLKYVSPDGPSGWAKGYYSSYISSITFNIGVWFRSADFHVLENILSKSQSLSPCSLYQLLVWSFRLIFNAKAKKMSITMSNIGFGLNILNLFCNTCVTAKYIPSSVVTLSSAIWPLTVEDAQLNIYLWLLKKLYRNL